MERFIPNYTYKDRVESLINQGITDKLQKMANKIIFLTFPKHLQNGPKSFNVMKCYFSDVDNCS